MKKTIKNLVVWGLVAVAVVVASLVSLNVAEHRSEAQPVVGYYQPKTFTSGVGLPAAVLFNTHSNFTVFTGYAAGTKAPVNVDTLGYRDLIIGLTGKNQENVTNNIVLIFGGNNDGSTNYTTNLTWSPVFTASNRLGAFTGLSSTNVPRYVYLLDIACSNNSSQFTNYALTFYPK